MNSPPSDSKSQTANKASSAFTRLHPKVRRWVWLQNWTELRDAQEEAVEPILAGDVDVIISAATAGGKTEAAFLPICSKLLTHEAPGPGVRALCISPLKALINDQFRRLEEICEHPGIPVHRWHGDASPGKKRALIRNPSGILLITPESLEAIFVVHGPRMAHLFAALDYVVVDELHAFMGNERGSQLQSLMHRLEVVLRKRIPRVGLSATLGEMQLAADFLRPTGGASPRVIVSRDGGQELKLQVKGYLATPPRMDERTQERARCAGADGTMEEAIPGDKLAISQHLFSVLRGADNLLFANSRRNVEIYSDILRRTCDKAYLPNEFWPHHGSLSKSLREEVEGMLKKKDRPISVICTNTLELGIDIGSVASVAQIGPPPSVAGMRQRLGRSGRKKGEPAVLRMYIREPEITPGSPIIDTLRMKLVQAVAMVELLIQRWCEPPSTGALHLSTLVQQVLSSIAQHGGAAPLSAWRTLCEHGPFKGVDQAMFSSLLRCLGAHNVLEQSADGTLLLGEVGERIVEHYSFFAAFTTREEYRVVRGGRTLGSLPVSFPLVPDTFFIFAGLRWRIVSVDQKKKLVEVTPAPGGRPPAFVGGNGPIIHDRVRREMLHVYSSDKIPIYLDARAKSLLQEAREHFHRLELERNRVVADGTGSLLFLWVGDKIQNTLMVLLRSLEMKVAREDASISISGLKPREVQREFEKLLNAFPSDPREIAALIPNKATEKYDWLLDDNLLNAEYSSKSLDLEGARLAIVRLTKDGRVNRGYECSS